MAGPVLSQRTQQRLIVAAALGVGGYAAYCAWRDNARLRKAVHSTVAELQRCGEAALTRTTACVVAGTVKGIAAICPQAVEAPAPREPWQAMALEKLVGLLTTNAGMDLVSLAIAVGAQHSVAALCEHWAAQRRAAAAERAGEQRGRPTNGHRAGSQQPQGPRPQNGQRQQQQQLQRQTSKGGPEEYTGHPIVGQLLEWASTPQGERFVVKAMAAAAANSTLAYMDSLGAGNSYEDVFAAAFAPRHRDALKELTVIATREAVAAYLCPPHRDEGHGGAARRQQQHSASWSATLQSVGTGTAFLIKQVSSNSKAAAVALPVVLLASSRGLALGCRDAFARFRADPSAAADYHSGLGFAPAKALLFDTVRSMLWLALCLLAALVLSFFGVRHLIRGDSLAINHT